MGLGAHSKCARAWSRSSLKLEQMAQVLTRYSVATRHPNEDTSASVRAPADFYNEAQSTIEAADST